MRKNAAVLYQPFRDGTWHTAYRGRRTGSTKQYWHSSAGCTRRSLPPPSLGSTCRVGELGARFVHMNQAAPYRSGGASLDPRGADEARPDTATPLQPAAPPATLDRLTELIHLAQGHEEAGRLNEAKEALCRALALAPEHAAALHLLG